MEKLSRVSYFLFVTRIFLFGPLCRTDNTWEPEENTDCPEMIREFEANRTKLSQVVAKRSKGEDVKKSKDDSSEPKGFARGLQAEKIIGATIKDDRLFFLIQWNGCDDVDLCPAKEANVQCPQVVIKFYEDRLTWITREDNTARGEDNIENAPAI